MQDEVQSQKACAQLRTAIIAGINGGGRGGSEKIQKVIFSNVEREIFWKRILPERIRPMVRTSIHSQMDIFH